MEESTDNHPESEFDSQSEGPGYDRGVGPSPEEGMRLVHAFVSIRSPERRRAVLEFAIEAAKMDGG